MDKFEYYICLSDGLLCAGELNDYGFMGWSLVSITPFKEAGRERLGYTFKRILK